MLGWGCCHHNTSSAALPCCPQAQAAATSGTSALQKLARVFREKAQQDMDRIVKGTSKTREKLGVRTHSPHAWACLPAFLPAKNTHHAYMPSP